ncbi:MAG: alpha/beta hydrolase [Treponema sp.]|uniref:alpha/beta hydrolase n=1 Tax=Treponema sp. TaxID=166 RepID=UPI00298DE43F|nr:alpha/beta hydrolase [Treponema sp.]MBR5932576.1 alpha/beta hydrolase [Treponema sp.]
MNDYLRESFSYFGLFKKIAKVKKEIVPESVQFGENKDQYFLYYEPKINLNDKGNNKSNDKNSAKIIFWIHGGGWNAGDPKFFDYVGQCVAGAGYRFVSIGYRLSPKFKYPCQINDVCKGFNSAVGFLKNKNIDVSKIVVAGPSAGAHLTSILCYCIEVQKENNVDISNIIGYVGFGGPYSFRKTQSLTLKLLLNQLFTKDYDRKKGEPVSLMSKNHIPMLLIQSEHDGLIEYECAEDLRAKALAVGNKCEIYRVCDKKNTHSWYTAGLFAESRQENKALDKFFTWIEEL